MAVVFWRPLLGQGVFLGTDILEPLPPWSADTEPGFVPHNWIVGDTLDGHADKVHFYSALRSGDLALWNHNVSAGVPTLPETLSPFDLTYLVFPDWYAPGAAAALKLLAAMALMLGFLRSLGASRWAGAVAGIAYGLSGFFAAWTGWPHTAVSVLIPGLFWAGERLWQDPRPKRVVPLALVLGAMILGNFPAVVLYALLALVAYVIGRWVIDRNRITVSAAATRIGLGAVGIGLGFAVAAVYILPLVENLGTLDLSYRDQPPGAHLSGRFLLTLLSPAAFGNHHGEIAWWAGEQNWPEAVTYAGVSVLVLAALAPALPRRRGAERLPPLSGVAIVFWLIVVATVAVVFGGEFFTRIAQAFPFMDSNFIGRMRVVINFGLAALAGLGTQALLVAARDPTAQHHLKAVGVFGAAITAVLFAASSPVLATYWNDISEAMVRRATAEQFIVPVLAGVATIGAAVAAVRSLATRWLALALVAIVGIELAVAFIPVHAVTSRDDYYPETPGHAFLTAQLDQDERYAGSEWAFYPNTPVIFGHSDARGHAFHTAEYRQLLESVDPTVFSGGTPTNAFFSEGADIGSAALDMIGVGYWADDIRNPMRGGVVSTAQPTDDREIGAGALTTSVSVPDRGLRAVQLLLADTGAGTGEPISVDVLDQAGDVIATSARRTWDFSDGSWATFPIVGERLEPGSVLEIRIRSDDPSVRLGTDSTGDPVARIVAATDDGLRLVFADGVVIYERLSALPIVGWYADAQVVDDAEALRTAVSGGERDIALLSQPLGHTVAPPGSGSAEVVERGLNHYRIAVDADAPGVVVLAVASHPGWRALVDGDEAELVRADLAFQAVGVPSGRSEILFEFAPSTAAWGGAISLLTLLGLTVIWWRTRPELAQASSPSQGGEDAF